MTVRVRVVSIVVTVGLILWVLATTTKSEANATAICGDFACIDAYQCGYLLGTTCTIHPDGSRCTTDACN